eukprot:TRINITY_DN68448_c0_g1_i1.p1 TRINITY_DN68448_c0_g1~~TRINITY_DN68448_c0_g1_i1.p1  ORF type:complete len:706 (+),score=133.09 TRINITY_DN68448_c0_g1_i1:113-2230(+)
MPKARQSSGSSLAMRCFACLVSVGATQCIATGLLGLNNLSLSLFPVMLLFVLGFTLAVPSLYLTLIVSVLATCLLLAAENLGSWQFGSTSGQHRVQHPNSGVYSPDVVRKMKQEVQDATSHLKATANASIAAAGQSSLRGGTASDALVETAAAPKPSEQLPSQEDFQWPRLEELMRRMEKAMEPYQQRYRTKLGLLTPADRRIGTCKRGYEEPQPSTFLAGCPDVGCRLLRTLKDAQDLCDTLSDCGGVTQSAPDEFQIRLAPPNPMNSPAGETSWHKVACDSWPKNPTALNVWSSFAETMEAALDDPELHLKEKMPLPRTDDSIFLSISSYRDDNCPFTVRKAFERADHPEKLSVGVVQINCEAQQGCMWATGWAQTRRIIARPGADVDCLRGFCASPLGKPHCEAGRVRILRLPESMALGPFFTRYLNEKLWRRETFYMQVDAHISFRQGWDTEIIDQMRRTPSFPNSVISNYPPGGSPKRNDPWPKAQADEYRHPPNALCETSFEDVEGRTTMRMQHSGRDLSSKALSQHDVRTPRRSGFVAAGFFITHASYMQHLTFDPFMPWLFMGEEACLAVRFWTNGFDIYAPTVDVVSHEYVRKESPKFWETVTEVFNAPSLHNEVTALVIQRVQHLLGFPNVLQELTQAEPSLLLSAEEFGVGPVRRAADFVGQLGIDLGGRRQERPTWCRHGEDPPIIAPPSAER